MQLFALWGIDAIPEGYHIDHICPLAQAQTIEEAKKLCNYANLQLLPKLENIRKSDSKTPEGEEMCKKLLGREWIDSGSKQS